MKWHTLHFVSIGALVATEVVGSATVPKGPPVPQTEPTLPWAITEIKSFPAPEDWPSRGEPSPGQVRVTRDRRVVMVNPASGTVWIRSWGAQAWEPLHVPLSSPPTGTILSSAGGVVLVDRMLDAFQIEDGVLSSMVQGRAGHTPLRGQVQGNVSYLTFVTREGRADAPGRHHLTALKGAEEEEILYSMEASPGHLADFPTCGLRGVVVHPLLAPRLVWAISPDGRFLVAGSTHEPVVHLTEIETGLKTQINLAPGGTALDADAVARMQLGRGWEVMGCTVPVEEALTGRGVSRETPAFLNLAVDDAGFVWVERVRRSLGAEEITEVYDSEGRAGVRLPRGITFPVAFFADGFITLRHDDTEHTFVVAHRISRKDMR